MGVLSALAILAGLIVVHETGHFLAATLQGIRVSSFSIGFGPVLLERQVRGVQFALRAIPLGGFVGFPDDDDDSTVAADDPDLLRNRPLPQRALVIAAGVLANLLLAWLVLVSQGVAVGIPSGFSATPGVLVSGVQPEQPAAMAGLMPGDRITALAGHPLAGGQEAVSELVALIQEAPERMLTLGVERDGPSKEPEDHIAILCEVMAGMAQGQFEADRDAQARFFERHIEPWAARFFADLELCAAATFYKSVARVGRTFIELEAEAFKLPR